MDSRKSGVFTGTQSRDFKLDATTDFALADWKISQPKLASLEIILRSFRYNVVRVRMLLLLPAQIGALAMDMRGRLDTAELEITGGLTGTPSSEDQTKILNRAAEL